MKIAELPQAVASELPVVIRLFPFQVKLIEEIGKEENMRSLMLFGTTCVLLLFLIVPSTASAADLYVDCSGVKPGAFSSLQAAIDSLDLVGPNTIHLLGGPCNENIWIIDRQRLTITAEGSRVAALGFTDDPAVLDYLRDGEISTINSPTMSPARIGFTSGVRHKTIDYPGECDLQPCPRIFVRHH